MFKLNSPEIILTFNYKKKKNLISNTKETLSNVCSETRMKTLICTIMNKVMLNENFLKENE